MPFFSRKNIRTHYEVLEGLVDRDTITLHGNLASNTWFAPMVEVLSRAKDPSKKGRLILAEWRGCGKSTGLSSEAELNLPSIADDYIGLLRELGASGACAIGHSTGGLIALYAMRRAPDLFSRALLLDPVGPTGVQFPPEVYSAFTAMSQDRAMCETVMLGTIHGGTPSPELKKQIVDDAFGVHPLIWHGVAKMLHEVDFRSELPFIRQPVLVLHGEHDAVLPKEQSIALAKGLPNGRYLELSGRGHSCNVEDPELFVSHVNKFLFG